MNIQETSDIINGLGISSLSASIEPSKTGSERESLVVYYATRLRIQFGVSFPAGSSDACEVFQSDISYFIEQLKTEAQRRSIALLDREISIIRLALFEGFVDQ